MSLELEIYERFKFYELKPEEKMEVASKLEKTLSKYSEVLLAIIYGSFLRDRPLRDIDIAVYVSEGVDSLDYKFKLDRELSEKLGYPIDVRVLNDAPPWFVLEVLENGKILIDRVPGLVEKLYKKALDERILVSIYHIL